MKRLPSQLGSVLLLTGLLSLQPGCGSAPPPPVVVAEAKPALPPTPIPKEEYLRGWVDFVVEEVFVGTPTFRSALHWQVAARLTNRGNRTITTATVRFHFPETGHQEQSLVLDPNQDGLPLEPGQSRTVIATTAKVQLGTHTPITPTTKMDTIPPPPLQTQVVELTFADEPPPVFEVPEE